MTSNFLNIAGLNKSYTDNNNEKISVLTDLNLSLTDNKIVSLLGPRSEEHTSELQSRSELVCRLLLEKKQKLAHTRLLMFW